MADRESGNIDPAGLRDIVGDQINPATEDKQEDIIGLLGSVTGAKNITEYNITCTVADTEYSQLLPDKTLAIEFKNRGYNETRWSFATGKVATPTAPYNTLKPGATEWKESVYLSSKTLYFASATAGDVIELIVFT